MAMAQAAGPVRLFTDIFAMRDVKFDRLTLLTFFASLYFFQIWGIKLLGGGVQFDDPASLIKLGLMLLSLVGVLQPRFHPILLINTFIYVAHYLLNSPIKGNNQITAFFVCVVILAGAAVAYARRGQSDSVNWRDDMFNTIAGPGRWILSIMYLYGIYHKINTDFLNPAVSCAVELYIPLMRPFGLHEWGLGHYAAIYTTFIVEAIAMIALFIPRYKWYGILIGIPFHVAIGWTGYAYYKDFSTIVLVLYAMFLPAVTVERAREWASNLAGGPDKAARYATYALIGGVVLHMLINGVFWNINNIMPTHENFVWTFTVYGVAFYAFALAFTPRGKANGDEIPLISRPAWLMVFPVLYLLNGMSPYLGLKTESSISMFSNLHTEANRTNHLVAGQLPLGFNYQNDILTPISSNSENFDAQYVGEGIALVRYEFDRMLSQQPNLQVMFEYNGEVMTNGPDWVNTYENTPAWLRYYLIFKPIDFNWPKVCTH